MREQDRQSAAERDQIANCAVCHRSEAAHQGNAGDDPDILAAFGALAGCSKYVVSKQAVDKVARQKRAPLKSPICGRCGARGHVARTCPW